MEGEVEVAVVEVVVVASGCRHDGERQRDDGVGGLWMYCIVTTVAGEIFKSRATKVLQSRYASRQRL